MTESDKPQEAHCNKCGAVTNHVVAHTFKKDWEEVVDEEHGHTIYGWERWDTLRCLGCDTIHLRQASFFSENHGPRGEPIVDFRFAPPRLTRAKPAWTREFVYFNSKLRDLMGLVGETYDALAQGSCRLAAMGIRALAELVMVDQVGDHGNFDKNMTAFFESGFVAKRQQATFKDTLIEAGHAAMHRGFDPSLETIETLLDIIEPLIDDIYFKPRRAEEAGKAIPRRQRNT